jgi:hypothetical protein
MKSLIETFKKILTKYVIKCNSNFDEGVCYLQMTSDKIDIIDHFIASLHVDTWIFNLLRQIISVNTDPLDQLYPFVASEMQQSKLAIVVVLIREIEYVLSINHDALSLKDRSTLLSLIAELHIYVDNHICDLARILDTVESTLAKIEHKMSNSFVSLVSQCRKMLVEDRKVASEPLSFSVRSVMSFYESEFSKQVLEKPSDQLMAVLNKISNSAIFFLELNQDKIKGHVLAYFLERLKKSYAAYGMFDKILNLEQVKQILRENSPNDTIKILFIYFTFADICLRNFVDYDVEHDKVNELSRIWNPDNISYDTALKIQNFTNVKLYDSEIFKSRKRKKILSQNPLYPESIYYENNGFSSDYGILNAFHLNLFGKSQGIWRQDRFFCIPDFSTPSPTSEMYEAEIPFVSGASGMSTLFLPFALLMGRLETQQEFLYYLLAVAAYLVHGGLHSLHESFLVAQYQLNLLSYEGSRYQISGNEIGNYYHFFHRFDHDTTISQARTSALHKTAQFFSMSFKDRFIGNSEERLGNKTLSPNKFSKVISEYDLDLLRIKKFMKILSNLLGEQSPEKQFLVRLERNGFIFNQIKQLILTLRTSQGIGEFDQALRVFDQSFINYVDRFNYEPSKLWQEINDLQRKQFQMFEEFEDKHFSWYPQEESIGNHDDIIRRL